MSATVTAIRREARLMSVPCLRDLVPDRSDLTVDEALLLIRKARAAILTEGARLNHDGLLQLSREIREVCDELDQVRRLLLFDPMEEPNGR